MLDADGSTDGAEIPRFVGRADDRSGLREGLSLRQRRRQRRPHTHPASRQQGTEWPRQPLVRHALHGPLLRLQRLLGAAPAELDLDCDGFEIETVMNIRAAKAGLAIQEIPSYEHARVHGESNLRVIRDGWRIAKVIMLEWLSRRKRRQLQSIKKPMANIPGRRHKSLQRAAAESWIMAPATS